MIENLFLEIGILLVVTTVVATIFKVLRQPLIIAYIVAGVLIGPAVLDVVQSEDAVGTFSSFGIALLLFIVGLNLNPRVVKSFGKVALFTGIFQVLLTFFFGFLISELLGFDFISALYIGIGMTFSSTIIVLKILSDKKDLDALYGRVTIGILLLQDLVAVLLLMLLPSFQAGDNVSTTLILFLAKAIIIFAVLYVIATKVFPKIDKFIARSQEFLLLFSITWCLAMAALFDLLNFSFEIGALVAGVALSLSPYHYEITAKIRPLRDFFIMLFFILLGSKMNLGDVSVVIWPAIVLSVFILIFKPLIIIMVMGYMRYTMKNSFLTGASLAQISEFSLIIGTMGVASGQIPTTTLSLLTLVAIFTITFSTYATNYADKLFAMIKPLSKYFERRGKKIDTHHYSNTKNHNIILFGYRRIGYNLVQSLTKLKKSFLIVDYNPEVVVNLAKQGYDTKYGDANDVELINEINFKKTKMVISTIPDIDTNLLIVNKIREENKKLIIIVVSQWIDDAIRLYEEGATYVLMPHYLGGNHASAMIESYGLQTNKFLREKIAHMEHLKLRKGLGHQQPLHNHRHHNNVIIKEKSMIASHYNGDGKPKKGNSHIKTPIAKNGAKSKLKKKAKKTSKRKVKKTKSGRR